VYFYVYVYVLMYMCVCARVLGVCACVCVCVCMYITFCKLAGKLGMVVRDKMRSQCVGDAGATSQKVREILCRRGFAAILKVVE